jgi:hypothetical protein
MQIKSSDKVFLRAIVRPSGGVAAPTTCLPTGPAADEGEDEGEGEGEGEGDGEGEGEGEDALVGVAKPEGVLSP